MKTLKASELSAFLNETIRSDCYEFYFLEITTGLRLGEILALEWEDLDEENKTIRVNKQVRRFKNGMEVSTPKTQASIRTISISDECLTLLKGLKAKQPVGTKLMFPSPVTGTYYDPKSITYRLHRIQRRAGVPQIRFHDLRHPYVKLKTKKFRDFWSKKPTFRITLSSAFVFAPSETNRARENLLLHSLFQFDCP
nr:site-specific integrase [uncultured Ruminococcus sp.]